MPAVGIIRGLGYKNWGCLCRLGARLNETRLFALFGGWLMQTEAAGNAWHRLGAQLCELKLLASFEESVM
jgi:hypothetical protein